MKIPQPSTSSFPQVSITQSLPIHSFTKSDSPRSQTQKNNNKNLRNSSRNSRRLMSSRMLRESQFCTYVLLYKKPQHFFRFLIAFFFFLSTLVEVFSISYCTLREEIPIIQILSIFLGCFQGLWFWSMVCSSEISSTPRRNSIEQCRHASLGRTFQ
jgi:hypothetical protein